MIIKSFLLSALVLVCLVASSACDLSCVCDQREVDRKLAGGGDVEFVLVEKSCGATVADAKYLYLVLKGGSIKGEEPVLVYDRARNLRVSWDESGSIRVRYDDVRFFKQSVKWVSNVKNKPSKVVSIVLEERN